MIITKNDDFTLFKEKPNSFFVFLETLREANRFMFSLLPEAITLPIGNFYTLGPQNM